MNSIFDVKEILHLIEKVEKNDISEETTSSKIEGVVTGLSGKKFRNLMKHLVGLMPQEYYYLEIGIYQGMTTLIVANENKDKKIIGVDDFSQFDKDGENIKKIREAESLLALKNIEIISEDFEKFLIENKSKFGKKIGIYYFDASHDYRSQFLALNQATNYLAEGGIIIVDDCNYPHVRQATKDFTSVHGDYKLIFESYTGQHPFKDFYATFSKKWTSEWMAKKVKSKLNKPNQNKFNKNKHFNECIKTWWNGVNILMHDPENKIKGINPPLPNDLINGFLNQHGFAGCESDKITTLSELK